MGEVSGHKRRYGEEIRHQIAITQGLEAVVVGFGLVGFYYIFFDFTQSLRLRHWQA